MAEETKKPTHWMDSLGRVCTDEFMRSDKAHGDYQLAYNIPCVKKGRKYVQLPLPHNTPKSAGAESDPLD